MKTHRDDDKQKKLTDIFLKDAKPPSSSTMSKAVDEKFILARRLVIWFCRDLLPFSTVENEGFRDFYKSFNSDVKLPTRPNVSNSALDDIYKVLKQGLILNLKSSAGN